MSGVRGGRTSSAAGPRLSTQPGGGRRNRRRALALGGAGLALFLIAIRVLGAAADGLEPALRAVLPGLLASPAAGLGLAWLATYVICNGSVVAAVGVSLAASGIVDTASSLLMVAGSRLGAASFVVLVGFLDYYRASGGRTLLASLRLGLLTFVVTHLVYLPATGLGLLGLGSVGAWLGRAATAVPFPLPSLEFLAAGTAELLELGGPLPVILLALGLLTAALHLADRSLASLDGERLRARYLSRLDHRGASFAAGLVLTLATASIAFSVGILVPLFNRGHLSSSRVIPYLLGANLGTLADTVLVALVLETPEGAGAALTLLAAAVAVTACALAVYGPFRRMVDGALEAMTASRLSFLAFGGGLVAVPLALTLMALV